MVSGLGYDVQHIWRLILATTLLGKCLINGIVTLRECRQIPWICLEPDVGLSRHYVDISLQEYLVCHVNRVLLVDVGGIDPYWHTLLEVPLSMVCEIV